MTIFVTRKAIKPYKNNYAYTSITNVNYTLLIHFACWVLSTCRLRLKQATEYLSKYQNKANQKCVGVV